SAVRCNARLAGGRSASKEKRFQQRVEGRRHEADLIANLVRPSRRVDGHEGVPAMALTKGIGSAPTELLEIVVKAVFLTDSQSRIENHVRLREVDPGRDLSKSEAAELLNCRSRS